MMIIKRVITAIGVITILLLTNQAQALDGAGLYTERTCIACHGVEGRVPVMSEYPKIAGQNAPCDRLYSTGSAQAGGLHMLDKRRITINALLEMGPRGISHNAPGGSMCLTLAAVFLGGPVQVEFLPWSRSSKRSVAT